MNERDKLLIRNVVEWIADKYVEDEIPPTAIAAVFRDTDDPECARGAETAYTALIEMTEEGKPYFKSIETHNGNISLTVIKGGCDG